MSGYELGAHRATLTAASRGLNLWQRELRKGKTPQRVWAHKLADQSADMVAAATRNTTAWHAATTGIRHASLTINGQSEERLGFWGAMEMAATTNVAIAVAKELKSRVFPENQQMASLAYRIAEKLAILYFLKEAHRPLDIQFKAIQTQTAAEIEDEENIFLSQSKWERFKHQHFNKQPPSSKLFLDPWLHEMNQIVATIEQLSLPEPPDQFKNQHQY